MSESNGDLSVIKSGIVAVGLTMIAMVVGVSIYNVNDRSLMAKNIDSAIAKGLDPISVRCSFAESDDTICVAMAASQQSNRVLVSTAGAAVAAPKK